MGKLLGWTPSPHYHEKNLKAEKAKKDTNISDAIINQIKRLNSKDISLFEKAKKLKSTVNWAQGSIITYNSYIFLQKLNFLQRT